MEIYYVNIEEFKKTISKEELLSYQNVEIKNEKRFFEYTTGRYLVKNVAKKYYNISDTNIILNENNKPVFKDSSLNFNISHSKNMLVACFDEFPCGVDIEYIKTRNLEKLSKYFKKDFANLEDFYKFWTLKEASYKLGCTEYKKYSSKFQNDYILTAVSPYEFEVTIKPYTIL